MTPVRLDRRSVLATASRGRGRSRRVSRSRVVVAGLGVIRRGGSHSGLVETSALVVRVVAVVLGLLHAFEQRLERASSSFVGLSRMDEGRGRREREGDESGSAHCRRVCEGNERGRDRLGEREGSRRLWTARPWKKWIAWFEVGSMTVAREARDELDMR